MQYVTSIWRGTSCNECHSKDDVKEIEIGEHGIFLCKKCREKLSMLLISKVKEG